MVGISKCFLTVFEIDTIQLILINALKKMKLEGEYLDDRQRAGPSGNGLNVQSGLPGFGQDSWDQPYPHPQPFSNGGSASELSLRRNQVYFSTWATGSTYAVSGSPWIILIPVTTDPLNPESLAPRQYEVLHE